MKYLKAAGAALIAFALTLVSLALSVFDKSVEGVLKDFSKLDRKLDAAMERVNVRVTRSLKRSEALRNGLRAESTKRESYFIDYDRAVRVRKRLRDLVE